MLSTCGFGDNTAKDNVEMIVCTILIFVSINYYSYTIEKISTFVFDDSINPGEYTN